MLYKQIRRGTRSPRQHSGEVYTTAADVRSRFTIVNSCSCAPVTVSATESRKTRAAKLSIEEARQRKKGQKQKGRYPELRAEKKDGSVGSGWFVRRVCLTESLRGRREIAVKLGETAGSRPIFPAHALRCSRYPRGRGQHSKREADLAFYRDILV